MDDEKQMDRVQKIPIAETGFVLRWDYLMFSSPGLAQLVKQQ